MNDKQDQQLDSVTLQAVEWFSRMRESELSSTERARFDLWIAESPVHVREYLGVAELWGTFQDTTQWSSQSTDELLAQARASVSVVPLRPHASDKDEIRHGNQRRKFTRFAAAAALLLTLGTAATFWMHGWFGSQTLSTARGEQRSLVLSDGSVVQLNTLTRIEVHFDETLRRIDLPQGEAFFRVAHDARKPFEVVTPFGVVRAVGTEFNVYSRLQDMRVAVVEGKVQVSASGSRSSKAPPTLVTARQSVEVAAGSTQAVPLPASETKLATAWLQRRLAFENERLDNVILEFNRYNRVAMRIDDAALAGLRINGVFNADDSRALIGYLQRVQGVTVDSDSNGGLILRREKKR